MKKESALPIHIQALYSQERSLLQRLIRILFSIAGISWFLLLLPPEIISPDRYILFKSNQYQLYLVLMTLWGYDYRRESRRLAAIATVSSTLQKPVDQLNIHDLDKDLHLFEILRLKPKAGRRHFAIWLNNGLLLVSAGMIIRQFIALFGN
jgi:hypothetical protein